MLIVRERAVFRRMAVDWWNRKMYRAVFRRNDVKSRCPAGVNRFHGRSEKQRRKRCGRARGFINNRNNVERARARSRFSADNGQPRVFAALITVSNAECGKKDGDECAAKLVTDGGSRDPLCQSRERARLHREIARSVRSEATKCEATKCTHATLYILPGRIPRSRPPCDLSNSPAVSATAAVRNHVGTGMQIRAITGRDMVISRSGFQVRRDSVNLSPGVHRCILLSRISPD